MALRFVRPGTLRRPIPVYGPTSIDSAAVTGVPLPFSGCASDPGSIASMGLGLVDV